MHQHAHNNLTAAAACGSEDIHEALEVRDHFSSDESFPLYDCAQCALRFTNRFPSEDSIGAYYDSPNYISHTDTREGLANRLYHFARGIMLKRKTRLVLKHTTHRPVRLLDMGCGTGYFLNEAKKKGFIVTGIEKDSRAREFAKAHFGLDVAEEKRFWELEKGSFHVVTLWHVLEHIEKLSQSIEKIKEMLTDDGVAIIACPTGARWTRRSTKNTGRPTTCLATCGTSHPIHGATAASPRDGHRKKYPMPMDAYYISMLSEKYKRSNALARFVRPLLVGTADSFAPSLTHNTPAPSSTSSRK